MRRMSSPPACGPAAVENAPLTISAKAPSTLMRASHASRAGARRRGARSRCARAATAASPVATTATRKWLITSSGLRSKSTVTAPSGICPNVSSATPPARRRAARSPTLRAESQVSSAARMPASAIIAVRELDRRVVVEAAAPGGPCSSGQSGQPSPEPVRRTNAPEAMLRNIATTSTRAKRSNGARVVRDHAPPGALRETRRSGQRRHRRQLRSSEKARRAAARAGSCPSSVFGSVGRVGDRARVLDRRGHALAVRLQLRREGLRGYGTGLQHDDRVHDVAALGVGPGDRGRLAHGGVRAERRLHLDRPDAVAGGDDDVVGAALEPQPARRRRGRRGRPCATSRPRAPQPPETPAASR